MFKRKTMMDYAQEYFLKNIGQRISHQDLIKEFWGYDYVDESSLVSLRALICNVRKKLPGNLIIVAVKPNFYILKGNHGRK